MRHGARGRVDVRGFFSRLAAIAVLCVAGSGCLVAVAGAAGGSILFGEGVEGEGVAQFREAKAIAIDNSGSLADSSVGDVYVADNGNERVDKFGPGGEFLLAWGWGVADGEARLETCGPAASPATSKCYVGLAGSGAGQFRHLVGVAVDGDVLSGSVGDVFVVDGENHRVEKFGADGEFLLAFGGEVDASTHANVCTAVSKDVCQAGVEGGEPGEFGFFALKDTVAVDSSGTVYVGDVSRVQEFSEGGVFERQVTLAPAEQSVSAVAVDAAGRIYVMTEQQEGVRVYTPCAVSCVGEEEAGSPIDPAAHGYDSSVTLGPTGEVFVAEGERASEYEPSGVQVADFPAGLTEVEAAAFADGVGDLYSLYATHVEAVAPPVPGPLVERGEAIAEPLAHATVRASIDREGAQTKYHLVYGLKGATPTETAVETMVGEGFAPETVEVKLSGLEPAGEYEYHFVAENTNGISTGVGEVFTALPAAGVEGESASEVSAESVRLGGLVNPLGSATEYRFEYGRTTSYEEPSVPAPDGSIGSGVAPVVVGALIEGLAPGTVYHYRIVAHNALGETNGTDRTFTTQPATSPAGLIDGRQWEMVTPPNKHGAPLEMSNNEAGVIQAAGNGGAISYFALAPAGENEPAGNRSFAYTQLLSTRTSPGVWSTQDIATPQKNVQGLRPGGAQTEYKLFSSDLSAGLVEPEGATPLSEDATERTPYLRDDHTGEYVPLLPANGLRPGTKFGGTEQDPVGQGGGGGFAEGVEFVTGTPDLSHVVLRSHLALTGAFQPGFSEGPASQYEWNNGAVSLVSVLPNGQPAAEAGLASRLGDSNKSIRNAISSDGTRLVFEASNASTGTLHHLYLRDVSLGETLRIDTVQAGVVNPGEEQPRFLDATADGGRVFFVDSQRLTTDSVAGAGEPDLYMCEVTVVGGGLGCVLKDLSVALNPLEAGQVSGADLGIDETGTHIYFVAAGVLAPGGVTGQDNLYVEDTSTRQARLVTVLSSEDAPDWIAGTESNTFSQLTSRVSGNGRFVAFMSDESLTGYNNTDARSGAADEEVFLYDAGSGSHPPTLRCVSCDPSGARPVGVFDPGAATVESSLLVDKPGVWEGRWLAGSLPGWPLVDNEHALYEPRNLSGSGRVFFDSVVGLVGGDGNGKEDVYEFEPSGVGGCALGGGCVGLISSGASAEESAFVDASGAGPGGEEGEDVFFMSASKLVGQDVDSAMDIYDAHRCSVVALCASGAVVVLPACDTADSCRAAPMSQPDIFGAPASATFSGPGNLPPATVAVRSGKSAAQARREKLARALKACHRKKSRHRRVACEKRAHRRAG